jgi:dipeptidyl aminopeptidase/acylaminoacyl peptidase
LGPGWIEVLDAATGHEITRFRVPGSESGPRGAATLAVSPDGRTVAAASGYGRLQTWDARTGAPGWPGDPTFVSAFSPDGKSLVHARSGGHLVFLDAAGSEAPRQVHLPARAGNRFLSEVTAISFSPDGRRLAVATGDGQVRLCDPATGEQRTTFPPADVPPESALDPRVRFSYGAPALAFSRDGKWLLVGDQDGSVRLWEVDTRQEARRLAGHERRVTFVAFGPGQTTALSAADDGGVYQWDLRPADGPAGRPAWDELASPDAAVAYRALWALLDDPAAAVRMLRANLPRAVEPKPEELARLIARLDSDEFAAREAASKALVDLGPLATPALRAALDRKPPAEARERITKLLDRAGAEPSAVDRRAIRGVSVLERIGTADARALLTEWAAGAPAARLTGEAKAALARLAAK